MFSMLSSIILLPCAFPSYLVLRTIGIPTRAISNFNSAHDTDANCTYDRYYDENGEYLAHLSRDSTWWEFRRFYLIKKHPLASLLNTIRTWFFRAGGDARPAFTCLKSNLFKICSKSVKKQIDTKTMALTSLWYLYC